MISSKINLKNLIKNKNQLKKLCHYSTKSIGNYDFLKKTNQNLNEKTNIFLIDKYSSYTYETIFKLSKLLSYNILKTLNKTQDYDLKSQKIGIYCSNNYSYLISILSIWMLNGVPYVLNKSYPTKFIEYFLTDSKCQLIINGLDDSFNLSKKTDFDLMLEQKNIKNLKIAESKFFKYQPSNIPTSSLIPNNFNELIDYLCQNPDDKEAFLLYTSGTSGSPKGVVITFKNLFTSIETMIDTYKWTSNDFILNPLPINHYSGLIYCLLTPFFVGATVSLMPKFNARNVWSKLLDLNSGINSLIAVPTIYTQLVQEFENNEELKSKFNPENVSEILRKKMRLVGSGSAPLSVKTFDDWCKITNYPMVERYGMTEIGMALSTPLIETDNFKRIAGTVGRPCGHVKVRLYDTANDKVLIESNLNEDIFLNDSDKQDDIFGEIQINGPTVFKEYLNKTQQTNESFTHDGWFKTGDTAKYLKELNVYKVIGRTSVDVIKSGGHKLSALDVEKEILSYDLIEDVAVMGLSDPVWGQRVFALLVLKQNTRMFNNEEFINWCKLRLPKYSVPTRLKIVDKIPRNQLGKINKKELIQFYENNNNF